MERSYDYINDIGEPKRICVEDKNDNGEYPITIWSTRTGDFCGSGTITEEKLEEWFEHYGISR